MTLDLTKPMRWKKTKVPFTLLWHDDKTALVDLGTGTRCQYDTCDLLNIAENMPPEPPEPAGPEEVWVSFRKESHIYGELWSAHKSREYAPSVATAVVRYLRADLAARKEAPAPQRVKPLTYKECTDVPVRMDMWFREVMAARGIEVGE